MLDSELGCISAMSGLPVPRTPPRSRPTPVNTRKWRADAASGNPSRSHLSRGHIVSPTFGGWYRPSLSRIRHNSLCVEGPRS